MGCKHKISSVCVVFCTLILGYTPPDVANRRRGYSCQRIASCFDDLTGRLQTIATFSWLWLLSKRKRLIGDGLQHYNDWHSYIF